VCVCVFVVCVHACVRANVCTHWNSADFFVIFTEHDISEVKDAREDPEYLKLPRLCHSCKNKSDRVILQQVVKQPPHGHLSRDNNATTLHLMEERDGASSNVTKLNLSNKQFAAVIKRCIL